MRKTLAFAGAAFLVLGVGGLASSASAGVGTIQAVAPVLNEAGVDLVDAGTNDIDGTFLEIENLDTAGNLDNFRMVVCNDTTTTNIEFSSSDTIAAGPGSHYLVASNGFNNPNGDAADRNTDAILILDHSNSAAYIEDLSSGQVNGLFYGEPSACDPTDLSNLTQANDFPTSSESLDRTTSPAWDRVSEPTPESQIG